MLRNKLFILLAALLLKATSSLAQTTPAPAPRATPAPEYQQVAVPVPRAVTLLADVVSTLFSREDTGQSKVQNLIDRRRKRSEKRDQSLTITLPNNRLTRTLGLME